MRICVCSLTFGDYYKTITRYGRDTKIAYCQKHGYDFKDDDDIVGTDRHPAWYKIQLILRYLDSYDYVFWVDGDTFIMNPEITLESLIEGHMMGLDIMVVSDFLRINTGVFFVKNTDWSREFLRRIWISKDFHNSADYEQNAFIDLYYANIINAHHHIRSMDHGSQNLFNSYHFSYHYGCFILHFPGCRPAGLDMSMREYCPIRMDDDTDETYQDRMEYLRNKNI
jgi:hypothetical protein